MRARILLATIALCVGIGDSVVRGAPPQEAATTRATTFDPPRLPDGRPDFQGNWQGGSTMGRSSFLDGYLGDREQPKPVASVVIDPPDGKIPYKSWALAKREELWYDYIDPFAACTSMGTVRQMMSTPRGFQIFQTTTRLAILNEWGHVYRVIPLDGTPHLPSSIRLFMGASRGRWDGDTLVVSTKNFNGKTWLTVTGDFHSDRAEVIERFTHSDVNTIRYQVTVMDPYVYTRPWTMVLNLQRFPDPTEETWEEECHGGNVDFPHLRELYKGFFGFPK